MSEELKPCLCGGKVRWCSEGNPDPIEDHDGCHYIKCDSCGLIAEYGGHKDIDNAETLEEMRKLEAEIWNTRASPWISVEERLPEIGMACIIYTSDHINELHITGAVWCGDFFYDQDHETGELEDVTHWMLSPEPPTSDKS